MSTISTLIAQARAFVTTLRSSIWAIDVRDGIGDSIQKLSEAIEQCYSDVSNPTLQTEALEAALQNKIDQGEMAALTIGDHTITAAKLAQGVIDNTLATSGAAADAKKTGDEIAAVKADLDALEPGLSQQAKVALLKCFSHVMWDNAEGHTEYYNDLKTALDIDPLDDIAYGSLTYRDMFVTGNLCKIGDFEGDITLSSSDVTLDNGDIVRIKNGSPSISTDYANTGTHSLKVFGTSGQYVQYVSRHLPKSGKLLLAASVKCTRRSAGKVGAQFVIMNGATTLIGKNADVSATTTGFEQVIYLHEYDYDSSDYNDVYLYLNMGTLSSPNADGYIDDVVATIVPATLDSETAAQLYANYLEIIGG